MENRPAPIMTTALAGPTSGHPRRRIGEQRVSVARRRRRDWKHLVGHAISGFNIDGTIDSPANHCVTLDSYRRRGNTTR
jgi:hypothetical protein